MLGYKFNQNKSSPAFAMGESACNNLFQRVAGFHSVSRRGSKLSVHSKSFKGPAGLVLEVLKYWTGLISSISLSDGQFC